MKPPKIHSIYDLPTAVEHHFPESLTEQHHADECDINHIVARATINPSLLEPEQPPQYLDVSDYPDFAEMCNKVAEANSLFEDLPSEIRAKFENSTHNLMAFMSDEKNIDEAIQLGLFKPDDLPPEGTEIPKVHSKPPESKKTSETPPKTVVDPNPKDSSTVAT